MLLVDMYMATRCSYMAYIGIIEVKVNFSMEAHMSGMRTITFFKGIVCPLFEIAK